MKVKVNVKIFQIFLNCVTVSGAVRENSYLYFPNDIILVHVDGGLEKLDIKFFLR